MRPLFARTLFVAVLCATAAFAGDLTERYHLTLDRVLAGGPPRYDEQMILADLVPRPVRRFTEFSGDVSGRWLGALALAPDSPRPAAQLEVLLPGILKLQKSDGHFGDAFSSATVRESDMAMLWGNGRLLIGLMESYARHPRPEVLATATRLGDFLVNAAPALNADSIRQTFNGEQFATGYICWTQNLEGVVALYRATHEPRFLGLARQLAERTSRHDGQHSHGFVTSLRGVLALYEATGEAAYLQQAEREWQGIVDSGNVLTHGALPEAFRPKIKRDEGCSEADWLRFNLGLWRATGKAQYLEAAELNLFNEFHLNQFSTGDFGHRLLSDGGVGQEGARAWWCCTLHGLRAFADVFAAVFRSRPDGLSYDLPVDGRGEAGGFRITAESSLEKDGAARLDVTAADGRSHMLSVRQPAWASGVELRLNGKLVKSEALNRVWRRGDRVEVRYAMRTRAVAEEKRIVLFQGPWLLSADETRSPAFFDEPHTENRVSIARNGGDIVLERVAVSEGAFAIPAAHFKLGYLPGGYALQPGTALLRPIAEQTGSASTAWEFRFSEARR